MQIQTHVLTDAYAGYMHRHTCTHQTTRCSHITHVLMHVHQTHAQEDNTHMHTCAHMTLIFHIHSHVDSPLCSQHTYVHTCRCRDSHMLIPRDSHMLTCKHTCRLTYAHTETHILTHTCRDLHEFTHNHMQTPTFPLVVGLCCESRVAGNIQ